MSDETTMDPRLFEAGVRLGTMVDPDYLTPWAEVKLPKLLADNPGATADAIVDLALEQIPAKFRIEIDTREGRLYDRIRSEMRERREKKQATTGALERLDGAR